MQAEDANSRDDCRQFDATCNKQSNNNLHTRGTKETKKKMTMTMTYEDRLRTRHVALDYIVQVRFDAPFHRFFARYGSNVNNGTICDTK
jgi:hypothetical protein